MKTSQTAIERCGKAARREIRKAMKHLVSIKTPEPKPFQPSDYERCYRAFGMRDWAGRDFGRISNGIEISDVLIFATF